ncbi:extracellular solute-binding protein [Thermoflavimicrobium dichotomicum]|uniref:Maltodextrin-binding protein n=1 Tax=Thermoflavimicrobium dichotomicum TaxID=46223 RepID=A0A1I3P0M5_9BACL|nr:extracellular solute-binding protein [Thermoflavimicrobium dichotomicum]SFJ14850.1 arabinogalactan oligomer / maltooligosaccharide transport system substrate-binding protein [Thermoflavimicrobium dichotomicum]
MKKFFSIAASLALMVSMLVGCSSADDSASNGQVTITFWNTMNDEETETLKEMIANFEKENKNIKVKVENVPFAEAQNKFKQAAQSGNAPDVLRSEIAWTPEFAALGFLEPLDSYLKDQSDFLEVALKYSKWNGKTWSVPQVTDTLGLLYNKKLLAEKGFKEPPKTWDEFYKMAKALSDPAKDQWGYYHRQSDAYWAQPFIWSFGGGLITDNKEIQINSPGSVKGLEFLLKLRDDKVMPDEFDAQNDYNNLQQAFKTGRAAMVLQGPWAVSDILKGEQFKDPNNLGIAPIPTGPEGKTGSPVGGHGLVIYAGSKHKEASFKFISYLTSAENQAKFAKKNGLLPARKSAYDHPDVKNNRLVRDWKKVLNQATNRPVIPEGGQIYIAFSPEIQAAFKKQKNAKQALDAVAQAWKQLLHKQ